MRLVINHTSRYSFDHPVSHGLQRLRLTPKSTQGQHIADWTMTLQGAHREVEYEDQHYNHTTLITLDAGVTEVSIACSGTVETADNAGIIGMHAGHLPIWTFQKQTALTLPGPKLKALAARFDKDMRANPVEALHGLSRAVIEAMRYEIGRTNAETTAEAALSAGHGVCQDHAHVFIGAARMLGIPARYVSGYLMMNDRIDQEAGHGWAEAYVEGLGWVAFDVSNGISPDARYVRVATGSDYREAAPITGISWGAGGSALSVSLAVEQQLVEQ